MPLFYVDTSALLKRYKTEKGTDVVDALFSGKKTEDVFVSSHLTSVEVESAAARALKAKILSRKAYLSLLALFADDLQTRLTFLPVSTSLILEASEVASRYAVRSNDALHIASALRLKEMWSGTIVAVASDKEVLEASRSAGLETLNPESPDALIALKRFRR